MALIKCPECGKPVSDKAPFCPNCGVEIAGKVATAQQQPTTTQPQPAPETATTPPETPKAIYQFLLADPPCLQVLFLPNLLY